MLQTETDFLVEKEVGAWKWNFEIKRKLQLHSEDFVQRFQELLWLIGLWLEIPLYSADPAKI